MHLWSAACARGEEPYSIAMALADFAGERLATDKITIHATDINRPALAQARAGIFAVKDLADFPGPAAKHFIRVGDRYAVSDRVRGMVEFGYFDLTSTGPSPFGAMDAIFCCNVLIYLHRRLQARLLNMLCKSLLPGGYLVLGDVETPTENIRDQLTCLDTKAKIYRKKG